MYSHPLMIVLVDFIMAHPLMIVLVDFIVVMFVLFGLVSWQLPTHMSPQLFYVMSLASLALIVLLHFMWELHANRQHFSAGKFALIRLVFPFAAYLILSLFFYAQEECAQRQKQVENLSDTLKYHLSQRDFVRARQDLLFLEFALEDHYASLPLRISRSASELILHTKATLNNTPRAEFRSVPPAPEPETTSPPRTIAGRLFFCSLALLAEAN